MLFTLLLTQAEMSLFFFLVCFVCLLYLILCCLQTDLDEVVMWEELVYSHKANVAILVIYRVVYLRA